MEPVIGVLVDADDSDIGPSSRMILSYLRLRSAQPSQALSVRASDPTSEKNALHDRLSLFADEYRAGVCERVRNDAGKNDEQSR
jgi:hypothetical protein